MPKLALNCRTKRDLELNDLVRETARKEGKSMADVLRVVLEQHLARHERDMPTRGQLRQRRLSHGSRSA
jgi:hypothetical protein